MADHLLKTVLRKNGPHPGSNRGPSDYWPAALTTELGGQGHFEGTGKVQQQTTISCSKQHIPGARVMMRGRKRTHVQTYIGRFHTNTNWATLLNLPG